MLFSTFDTLQLELIVELGEGAVRADACFSVKQVVWWVTTNAAQPIEVWLVLLAFRKACLVGDVNRRDDVLGSNHTLIVLEGNHEGMDVSVVDFLLAWSNAS